MFMHYKAAVKSEHGQFTQYSRVAIYPPTQHAKIKAKKKAN